MTEVEDAVDLYDLHHYAESVKEYPSVGDAIRLFHATCGGDYCEGCGTAGDGSFWQCKGCHLARYCTTECQLRDWEHGGHAQECKAIANGDMMSAHRVDSGSLVALRHLARCSAMALAKMATEPDVHRPEPDAFNLAQLQLHIGSFVDGTDLEPVGKNWMAGAVKHPGALRRAAAHADHGRFKGRATAFAHHVLRNSDHKHNSGLLRQRARLALTFARFRGHHHRGRK